MPNKISDLKPIKGEIFIATKPDTDVFGQKPRSGINLIVNVKDNTLMYKFNDNETWIDNYDSLKDKIVLMNKKYL